MPIRFPLPATVDRTDAHKPDVQPPPIKVDVSDLTPEEQERTLVELAESNAVAAFTLLTRALCDCAPLMDSISASTTEFHTRREYDHFCANNIYHGLFSDAILSDLDSLAQQTATQLGADSLASQFDSLEREPLTSLLSHGFYGDPDEGNPMSLVSIGLLQRTRRLRTMSTWSSLPYRALPFMSILTLLFLIHWQTQPQLSICMGEWPPLKPIPSPAYR